ncbi:MAG: YceI family protein, partial [Jiangellaceae bacterium]
MPETLGVRLWNGTTFPTAGTFEIDPQHTTVGFVARHLMVTQVRGRFEDVTASIQVANEPLQSLAHATIGTASMITGTEERDAHLKSADFLDVERYPVMTYVSRHLAAGDSGPKWSMVNGTMRRRRRTTGGITALGDLTIMGITLPIELDVAIDGITSDPWGG